MDSTRCCSTWLAAAVSRAILIVPMEELLMAKSEPRKMAEMPAAIIASIRVEPRTEARLEQNIPTAGASRGCARFYNYYKNRRCARPSTLAFLAHLTQILPV